MIDLNLLCYIITALGTNVEESNRQRDQNSATRYHHYKTLFQGQAINWMEPSAYGLVKQKLVGI